MSDNDERSWAEKRIDARRKANGLPTDKTNPIRDRLIEGGAALIFGSLFVIRTHGIGDVVGVALLVFAAYQLLVAAIAQGAKEGRSGK